MSETIARETETVVAMSETIFRMIWKIVNLIKNAVRFEQIIVGVI